MHSSPKEPKKQEKSEAPAKAAKPAHTQHGWSAAITLTPKDAQRIVEAAKTLKQLACAIDPSEAYPEDDMEKGSATEDED